MNLTIPIGRVDNCWPGLTPCETCDRERRTHHANACTACGHTDPQCRECRGGGE